jgi:DNA-binding NarL/FixJ family response regulator
MDMRMPVVNGIAATRRIVTDESASRVLVLTTFDLDEYVYSALQAGASGFLLKDAPEEQLLAAIRVVSAGGALFSPAVTRRLIDEFSRRREVTDRGTSIEALTPRENEVLLLMARGLSNAEIATELFLSEHTVKTHVARILGKLGLRDRAQAVVVATNPASFAPEAGRRNSQEGLDDPTGRRRHTCRRGQSFASAPAISSKERSRTVRPIAVRPLVCGRM